MALVSGGRSTLNPNAPLFVPAAVRQVEDFSPEWWQLVTTSTWFHDYWLSQHQEEDGFFGNDNDDSDIVDLLPDSIDTDEDVLAMEAQYEQFLLLSGNVTNTTFSPSMASNEMEAEGLMKSLSSPKSMKDRNMKVPVEVAKYREKPAKVVSPKTRPQRIQQPR